LPGWAICVHAVLVAFDVASGAVHDLQRTRHRRASYTPRKKRRAHTSESLTKGRQVPASRSSLNAKVQ